MADELVLTPAGRVKIEKELEHLRSVEMPALSERIRQARDLGDLSENFDYQDSKRQQGFLSGRIADLQATIDRARIVEEAAPGAEEIGMASTVTVRDLDYGDEFPYTLVGVNEADPENSRISASSPVGKALMGMRVGDKIQVKTPDGTMNLEIIDIL